MKIRELLADGQKKIAILIDPDKNNSESTLLSLIQKINILKPAFVFIGGSTVDANDFKTCISVLKANCTSPVVIFPGSHVQVDKQADAILFLSLVSGRNPDFLIGHQVEAAPILKNLDLEIIPTAYMLIHQLSSGVIGKYQDIEDEYDNCNLMMDDIIEIYKEGSSLTEKKIKKFLKRDKWWKAELCMNYGLVDDYIENAEPAPLDLVGLLTAAAASGAV